MNDGAIMDEGNTGCEGLVSEFAGKHDIFYISNSEGKMVVRIRHDGQVEFGPGYTPDEAAKEFWVALGYYAPKPGRSAGEVIDSSDTALTPTGPFSRCTNASSCIDCLDSHNCNTGG
jgi:hypothetical protein